jgi:hypothetical protein
MNYDIPSSLISRFSLLVDGGSLHHIFGFPTAAMNCMRMVREGGHFLSITAGNNLLGHGFYQFSPELFFKTFSPANGFFIEKLILVEPSWRRKWYEVSDPDCIRRRVTLINGRETFMMMLARKFAETAVLASFPQQGYFINWAWKHGTASGCGRALKNFLSDNVMDAARHVRDIINGRHRRGFDPEIYRKVTNREIFRS